MAPLRLQAALLLLLAAASATAQKQPDTPTSGISVGPSTTTEPYLIPMQRGVSITSLLTANDSVPLTSDPSKEYRLVGIPDGMGAYLDDETPDMQFTRSCKPKMGDYSASASKTFTLLLNHELGRTLGEVRSHGAKGAFVSEYIIDRKTLQVLSGEDLIKAVATWNAGTGAYNPPAKGVAFERFCSADLPAISAYYHAGSGLGTKDRIFMNGEETSGGRAFAHVATGPEKGITYELPRLGKGGWENQVACPHSGERTVVMGLDDSQDGQVYVYIGTKQATGSTVEKAGLTNGKLYGLKVTQFPIVGGKSKEPSSALPLSTSVGKYGPFRFELGMLGNGDVSNLADIEGVSDLAGLTRWNRPEDGYWSPVASTDGTATFYFATTAAFGARSRLWRVVFDNINDPLLGGKITAVVEGNERPEGGTAKMMDNLVANCDGSVYLQEDPGRQDYLSRIWRYHPDDGLIWLAQHNPKFFAPPSTREGFLTTDEESSGIISVDGVIANRPGDCFLVNTQAHYGIGGEIVEGAQIMLMCVKDFVTRLSPKQSPLAP